MTKRRTYLRLLALILALFTVITAVPLSAVAEGGVASPETDGAATFTDEFSSVREDKVLREDEFSKHFVDPNGKRYAVVYSEQVHYLDGGEWVDVDNRLVLDSTKNKYVSENPVFRTEFAQNSSDDELVRIEDGEYSISWSLSFPKETLPGHLTAEEMVFATPFTIGAEEIAYSKDNMTQLGKAVSSVEYSGITNGVDLRYTLLHGKVEEDVILNSAEGFEGYMMTVNAEDLTATKQTDGSVYFSNADGEIIFRLAAPWMSDADGNASDAIDVTVIQRGSVVYVAYEPDLEWLASTERTFPVMIDPSVTTRTYTSNIVDTYVYEGDSASTTRPTETTLKVGNVNGATHYAYIKVNSIPSILDSTTISAATFDFYVNTTSSPSLNLYEINESWSPTTTKFSDDLSSTLLASNKTGTASGAVSKYSIDISEWVDYYNYDYGLSYYMEYESWYGFKLAYTNEIANNYTQIYSSEYAYVSRRPTMTFEYYFFETQEIMDGGIYSFKNVASNKFLTVDSTDVSDNSNVYQYQEMESDAQAFMLDYDSVNECYKIVTVCSGADYDYVLNFDYSMTGSVTSRAPANVDIYCSDGDDSTDQDWLIEFYYSNYYIIRSKFDPDLVLTAYGTANGSPSGNTTSSAGNVYVSEFTGATNQLWRIYSGGVQLTNSLNIMNYDTLQYSETLSSVTLSCPVTVFGDTVTWYSSNPQSISINNSGQMTIGTAGVATVFATIENADREYVDEYSCTIYVIKPNGVYAFNNYDNEYRIECGSETAFYENENLYPYYSGTAVPTNRSAMFKICHIANGRYTVRSMLDNKMGWTVSSDGQLVSTTIGATPPTSANGYTWRIASNANGYFIYNPSHGNKAVTCPEWPEYGEPILLSTYSASNDLQCWTMTRVTAAYHGVAISKKYRSLGVGDHYQFSAVMYSSTISDNGQNGFTWSVTSSGGSATIDAATGLLKGVSEGDVVVSVSYNGKTWTPATYTTTIVPVSSGTYFIQNKEYGSFMQIDDDSASTTNGAAMELWNFDGASDQKWTLTYLNNGYYQITSTASKYLTAQSSLNTNITQSSTYSRWKITRLSDGSFKIAPSANESYYVSAASSATTGDGRAVKLMSNQTNGADEWKLYGQKDYALMFLGDVEVGAENAAGDAEMPPILDDVENALQNNAGMYGDGYTYMNKSDVFANMATSKIFAFITHGYDGETFAASDELISVDDILALDDSAFENVELVVSVACELGFDRGEELNVVEALYEKGATTVIGFTIEVIQSHGNLWIKVFLTELSTGVTIEQAMSVADSVVQDEYGMEDVELNSLDEKFNIDSAVLQEQLVVSTDSRYRYVLGPTDVSPCN